MENKSNLFERAKELLDNAEKSPPGIQLEIAESFGALIIAALHKQKLDIEWLALKLGFDSNYMLGIACGMHNIDLSVIARICYYLDIRVTIEPK